MKKNWEVNTINIKLDFSSIDCEVGHSNPYTNIKCEICGEDFIEFEPHIDPRVDKRKELVKPILDIINSKLLERTNWFKRLRKNEVSRIHVDEPFDKLQSLISEFDSISSISIFDDISFYSDALNNEVTLLELELFKDRMVTLIAIKFEAEKLELTDIWKNMNQRLINSIKYMFEGYLDFFNTLVSSNLQEAQLLQISGQEKINFATNEINILDRIINSKHVMISTDIFYGGEINQSALISMMFSCEDSISETIQESNNITKYYFRDFINPNATKDQLIALTPYMYLGTSLFDDDKYIRKINVVTSILKDAMSLEKTRFEDFTAKYIDRFLFAQRKATDIATDIAFVYGNTPSIEMLIRNSIRWYKDLSEGIYKDVSRIIYFSMNIVNNKNFTDDDILIWLGFGDIAGDFDSQAKLKLNLLTEGVVKIIRHAEAHVDYEVGDGIIILRNIVPHDKKINTISYTYEEFLEITNKLAESVYAIVCGILIHLYNNSDVFFKEINRITENEKYSLAPDMTGVVFALNGIVILKKMTENEILTIEGVLNRAVEQKDIGDKIFNACGHSTLFSDDIREIQFHLYNFDNEFLGEVIVQTEYFYQYKKETSDFKNFYLLLAKLTSTIDSSFHQDITNDKNLICLKSVFVYLLESISDINILFRDRELKHNDIIREELRIIHHKTQNLKRFLSIYKQYSNDEIIMVHTSMLVNQVDIAVTHMLSAGISSPTISQDIRNLKVISNTASMFVEYLFNKISKEEYIKMYLKSKPYLPKELTFNSPCLCGSGKKYKKCCRI